MKLFYDIFLHLLVFLTKTVSLFHTKTKQWCDGQKAIWHKLAPIGQRPASQRLIWFHAASLGEFEQGRPVIETFREKHQDWQILLTFFSPSGYEIRKDYKVADIVCYLPADTTQNVRRFLDLVQPDIVCFVKYEFWFNYLTELNKRKTPTLLFSAIFRPDQLFFKQYGGFYRKLLFCFDAILVQNKSSKKLLESIDYQMVSVAGDTRLDRVVSISKTVQQIPAIRFFRNNDLPLLIVGSAWPDDMAILVPFINRFTQPLQIIIAPHQIDKVQIQAWQKKLSVSSCLLSEIETSEKQGAKNENLAHADSIQSPKPNVQNQTSVLFIDSIGLLSSLYQYADFGYIGGAFGDGLHNILEPAVFGMPLFFGNKHYQKFQEAHDLLALGAAHTVSDIMDFERKFNEVYENQSTQKRQVQIAKNYVLENAGATEKVIEAIEHFVL